MRCRCCTPPVTCALPAGWTDCSTSRTAPSRTISRAAPNRSPRRPRPNSAPCRAQRSGASHRARHGGGVTITSDRGQAEAGFVIVAIPPAHRSLHRVRSPAATRLRPTRPALAAGPASKAYAAYSTPFWRANGLSGQTLSDKGPVFITFDVSPQGDGPGVLMGFVDARAFDSLPAEQRRRDALRCFAALFGDEALKPIDYAGPSLGCRGIRPGRSDRRGTAGGVDTVRAVVTRAGRADPLGRHRDRRPMDRISGRRRQVRSAGSRRDRGLAMS